MFPLLSCFLSSFPSYQVDGRDLDEVSFLRVYADSMIEMSNDSTLHTE
jgi:hypothetical protein